MNPYSIIENHFLNKRPEFSELSLFEAGFGDFGDTLDLYYKLPFRKYFGLEEYKESELKVLFNNSEGGRSSGAYCGRDSIYDRYINYCNNSKIETPIVEDKFSKIFKLIFEKRIEQYISEMSTFKGGFDMGIFSKLFHKFSDKNIPKKIVKWFYEISNVNSYLLFTVMTLKKHAYEGRDYIYSQDDISELKICFPGEVIDKTSCDSFDTYLIKKNGT